MFDTVGHTIFCKLHAVSGALSELLLPQRLHVCAMDAHMIQSLLHSREVTPDSLTRVDFCLPQAQAGRCTRVSECQARTLPAWGPASEGSTLGHELIFGGS